MSWLESVADEHGSGWGVVYKPNPSNTEFAGYAVVVACEERTGRWVLTESGGRTWLTAYPDYVALERAAGGFGGDVEHAQTTGRALLDQLRRDAWSHVGLLWRATRDSEHVVQWPQATPVARVAVDP